MTDSGFLALRLRAPAANRTARWATALATSALLGLSVVLPGLNGDIKYVLGCLRTARRAGFSPSETFTHRPYFYRWFIAGLDSLTAGPNPVREAVIRLAAVLMCVATGLLLRSALARRLPQRDATLTAVTTTLALALAPDVDYLQPEWAATLFSVLAIAVVFRIDRPWLAAVIASLPLGLAVMMKYSTAATAAMALLIVFAADRLRAVLLAAVTAVSGGALLGFSMLAGSHEWQWARDMPKINRDALTRQGIHPAEMALRAFRYLADRAILSPVLLLLPAALLLALSLQADRRRRAEQAALAVLVCLGCVAAVAVQGNWFAYHSAALPVFAAALWGLAVARWYGAFRRPPLFFTAITVLYGVLAPLVSEPAHLHGIRVAYLAGAAALAAALADLLLARRRQARTSGGTAIAAAPPRLRIPVAATALASVVCLAAAIWPGSPHQVLLGNVVSTNAAFRDGGERNADRAVLLRRQIPAGTPVLYMAFGDIAYDVGLPTPCRYPIPTFLQRTKFLPDVNTLPSYAEDARCLTDNPPAYAILQRSWFQLGQVDHNLAVEFRKRYVCPAPKTHADLTATVICHRK